MIIRIVAIFIGLLVLLSQCQNSSNEAFYLQGIKEDFIRHREDVTTIEAISKRIVGRIDSLFDGTRSDTLDSELMNGIMTTRAFDRTILAYQDILNGQYLSDPELVLRIARHTAFFEGVAISKALWDRQWDHTARPYIYANGLFRSKSPKANLVSDPTFRTILWDRRMFAYDVQHRTPRLLSSADSIIALIEKRLQ